MQIQRFIFGPFETNTYVITINDQMVLLIDPACSNAREQQQLLDYIGSVSAAGLTILATHGHLDHLWGAKWATDRWNVPVLIPEADIPMVKAMQSQYDLFGIRATPQPFPIESLSAALPQSLIPTPGHTPGSVCLYWPEEKVLLSGDTLFRGGYGRTDLPGGDTSQLIASLRRLATLPPDTQVFPGHGEATTIGSELR